MDSISQFTPRGTPQSSLNLLPSEVTLNIFSYFDLVQLARCKKVSRNFIVWADASIPSLVARLQEIGFIIFSLKMTLSEVHFQDKAFKMSVSILIQALKTPPSSPTKKNSSNLCFSFTKINEKNSLKKYLEIVENLPKSYFTVKKNHFKNFTKNPQLFKIFLEKCDLSFKEIYEELKVDFTNAFTTYEDPRIFEVFLNSHYVDSLEKFAEVCYRMKHWQSEDSISIDVDTPQYLLDLLDMLNTPAFKEKNTHVVKNLLILKYFFF